MFLILHIIYKRKKINNEIQGDYRENNGADIKLKNIIIISMIFALFTRLCITISLLDKLILIFQRLYIRLKIF